MISDQEIIAELNRIASRHGGLLKPEDVVHAAASDKSPLHSRFDWEDTEAARKWRLHQARNLIRVTVSYIGGNKEDLVRVFVSLTPDREDGGYRSTAAVLSDPGYRKQLLADALSEMKCFEQKYAALRELVEVFKAMRESAGRLKKIM